MGPGERLIWSAAFAGELQRRLQNPPKVSMQPLKYDDWKQWEDGQVDEAVAAASYAVDYAMKAVDRLKEGYSEDNMAYRRLKEMLND